jgi:ABC-type uncharacterized transport system substrate-binding protein
MLLVLRNLALGVGLIAAAAAVLLLADLGSRDTAPTGDGPLRVALVQYASQAVIDQGREGLLAELEARGYRDGDRIRVTRYNAEGDIATANAIAKQVVSSNYDLIVSITTVSLQTIANANTGTRPTRHVFGMVSNPYAAGVGIDPTDHLRHPPHMTGYGNMQPVAETFRAARLLNPSLRRVGVVWNSAEANSVSQLDVARVAARELGIELIEANAENSTAVSEGTSSVISRGAEAIWVGGDVTVLMAVDAVAALTRRARIPLFTSIPPTVEKGALFDFGADFAEIGRAIGALAADVLDGRDPRDVPVENFVPEMLTVNRTVLDGLRDRWVLPDEFVERAHIVIDASGRREKARTQPVAAASPARRKRVDLIEYVDTPNVEITRDGFMEGLQQAGIVVGTDIDLRRRNAQGDMSVLSTMVDAAVTERADLIVVATTPALQAVLSRGQGTDTVFMLVANPILTGAGTSDTDHLPHVTGAYVEAPHEEAVAVLMRLMPRARRIGTLFVPGEVNSVYYKDELQRAARNAGLELEAIGVSASGDVPDAALALCSRNVDAITQISDNLTGTSFASIQAAAKRCRLPLVGFAFGQAERGAVFTLSRDFHDGGVESALMAARIVRGETPAAIPMKRVQRIRRIYNAGVAAALGLTIP